jgi:hypothetical protein
MFQRITQIIVDCTTEKDGVTACPARIIWILGTFVFFVNVAIDVIHNKKFDYQGYAMAFAAIQAAGAAAVKIKETTEQKVS